MDEKIEAGQILATTRTFCTRWSIRSRYLVVSLNNVLPVEIREWEGRARIGPSGGIRGREIFLKWVIEPQRTKEVLSLAANARFNSSTRLISFLGSSSLVACSAKCSQFVC